MASQCIRKAKRAKPIDVLRQHALVDVVPVVQGLKKVLLFHPDPIWSTVTRKILPLSLGQERRFRPLRHLSGVVPLQLRW